MAIDIGPGATDRATCFYYGFTALDLGNPSNGTGVLTSFEVWANTNISGLKLGTFYGSSTSYTMRDYESIGSVTAGSKQTFTGKNCDVSSGDLLGAYWTGGCIEGDTSGGAGEKSKSGDGFVSGARTYGTDNGWAQSIYATGISAAAVTTNTPTSIAATSLTANGDITATGGSGSDVTRRGFCYMKGESGDPTTANSVAYDDGTFGTGAYTKSITGLSSSTNYRIRAYAVNAAGTAYGATVQAKTGTPFQKDIMFHHVIPPFLGGLI